MAHSCILYDGYEILELPTVPDIKDMSVTQYAKYIINKMFKLQIFK